MSQPGRALLPLLGITFLVGACASIGSRSGVEEYLKPVRFSAPIGEKLVATAGEFLFIEGELQVLIPALEMNQGIVSTMPGGPGFECDFFIDKCILQLIYQTEQHLYYCAPASSCGASHSGLGEVLNPGDFMGVRVDKVDGSREWFIDNSGSAAVPMAWTRPVLEGDNVTFSETEIRRDLAHPTGTLLLFQGFYGGQVHFQLIRRDGANSSHQEHHFDIVAPNAPTPVAIQSLLLEVLSASNLGIEYRWISIDR